MKKISWTRQSLFPYIIGNALDHYDTALYNFLCPFIAPLFFPQEDPWVALMLSFGIGACSFISRPLGALFFGRLLYKKSLQYCLILSLCGVAVSTASIAVIPPYAAWGIMAPLLLTMARFFQGFFAAGESSIAGLSLFEIIPSFNHKKFSGYYQFSSLIGIILASMMGAIISLSDTPSVNWRLAFLTGLAPGIIGIILRKKFAYLPSWPSSIKMPPLRTVIFQYPVEIFKVIIVSGFSQMTYTLAFVFLNSFVPLIAPQHCYQAMMIVNTPLLVVDLLLLLTFSQSRFLNIAGSFMVKSALSLSIIIVPLFGILKGSNLYTIVLVRLLIIVIGVCFCIPLQRWLFNQINGKERYIVIGLAHTIGTEIFGRSIPFVCWGIWNSTHWMYAPALYISFISILTVIALIRPLKTLHLK